MNVIRLTGTLTANVAITLPGIYKSWVIDNQLVNSPSSFAATLVSTSGASIIGAPPGPQDIFYDGTNVKYKGLGKIGEYWDYCGATIPTWITASTIPPYLNCDGTVISSATYPILTNLLGTTTLPDSRGSFRATLNQTTGRLTSSFGGVDGNTAYARGGSQTTTLGTSNLPPYTPSGTNALSTSATFKNAGSADGGNSGITIGTALSNVVLANYFTSSSYFAFSGVAQGGTSVPLTNAPPTFIGGITMIRAA